MFERDGLQKAFHNNAVAPFAAESPETAVNANLSEAGTAMEYKASSVTSCCGRRDGLPPYAISRHTTSTLTTSRMASTAQARASLPTHRPVRSCAAHSPR